MSECSLLIKELKKQLKLNGIQYSHIAKQLDLTESSVKRLLSDGEQLSLARLEKICQLLQMDIASLFSLVDQANKQMTCLSEEQEKQLVGDHALLFIAVCVVNGYSFSDILDQYQFTHTELIQKLAALDKLNIIELQPRNRIKLKVAPEFKWIKNGPIQQYFLQQVQADFFNSRFSKPDEMLVVATGLMTLPSNHEFQQKFQKLIKEFHARCKAEQATHFEDRHGTSLVMAIRKWRFSDFEQYAKTTIK